MTLLSEEKIKCSPEEAPSLETKGYKNYEHTDMLGFSSLGHTAAGFLTCFSLRRCPTIYLEGVCKF